nr:G2/mitotic-specific cyclin-2-like [Tanacetum cinerariifolium]
MEETLYLTVNLIDRFLERQPIARKKLQLRLSFDDGKGDGEYSTIQSLVPNCVCFYQSISQSCTIITSPFYLVTVKYM